MAGVRTENRDKGIGKNGGWKGRILDYETRRKPSSKACLNFLSNSPEPHRRMRLASELVKLFYHFELR